MSLGHCNCRSMVITISLNQALPSAEELRERVALGEVGAAGVAAAPAGSLGHLMLVSA